jgi:hypothetical protein
LPDGLFCASRVKPHFEKYFCFAEEKITLYVDRPAPPRGVGHVINAGRDAVDADGASDEGA